jgi:hypothetical protein
MSKSMMGRRWPASAAIVLAASIVSACSEPMGPGPVDLGLLPAFGVELAPGQVTVCKVVTSGDAGPYSFSVGQAGGREGSLPAGAAFELSNGECAVVWTAAANPPESDPLVTVTATEIGLPSGMQLDSVVVATAIQGDPIRFEGPAGWARVNFYHGATITFYNSQIETPPPACDGLTPGYWKNWRNHYSSAQFTSLLAGTIASTIAQADAIFANASSKDAVQQLAAFVLANQLTLNLTGTDLPNPDDAGLTLDCHGLLETDTLGDALDTALAMLANPGGYTRDQILAVKDVLDYIANLGD